MFEDDGDTGYLYALELDRSENPIVDALHIYNVANVVDRDRPSEIVIAWSADGKKAIFLVNTHPHAVVDFVARRGYCRSGVATPVKGWTHFAHQWSDDALALFR